MDNLKIAERTVQQVKLMLPYGGGNQKPDVTYTEGESWARRSMLRDETYCQNPIQHAKEAVRYQAGNCAEHANVSYTLLAGQQLNAPLLRVSDADDDHAYVLIGDPRDPEWGERDTVVVDAWATHPSAFTLAEADDMRPTMPPSFQRSRYSPPDPDANLRNVRHVTTEDVNQYLAEYSRPHVGPALLDHIDEYVDTNRFFNAKTYAKDPSTRYGDSSYTSKSMDRIAESTVDRQREARREWNNSPYSW
ncbi:type III effector [Ralstonia solanacearum]|uniref:type III effector n=1 Tax=Ralstonia solanacearum TaxID=305 RepID=UPI001E3D2979|nr:type III effector [Ralstonia solanacearum]